MQKLIISGIVVVLIVVGVGIYASRPAVVKKTTDTSGSSTAISQSQPTTTPAGQQPAPTAAAKPTWQFKTTDAVKDGDPARTAVTMQLGGKTYNAGTYDGTCAVSETSQLLANETSAVVCWFAGAGDEVGLFNENGKVVLKHGEVQEGDGDGGSQGFRGNFTTLVTI